MSQYKADISSINKLVNYYTVYTDSESLSTSIMPINNFTTKTIRYIILGMVASVVAGCTVEEVFTNPFAEYAPSSEEMLMSGWAPSDQKKAVSQEIPLYCYHTLGVVDCYKIPQPNEGNRLTGYRGSPPP